MFSPDSAASLVNSTLLICESVSVPPENADSGTTTSTPSAAISVAAAGATGMTSCQSRHDW